MINLDIFCSSGLDDERFKKPFTIDGKSYATNGNIIVEVPEQDGISHEIPISHGRIINAFWPHEVATEFIDVLGQVEWPETAECDVCRTFGYVVQCKECDGGGMMAFQSSRHEYHCECKECRGHGDLPARKGAVGATPCQLCDALGRYIKAGGDSSRIFPELCGIHPGVKLAYSLLLKIKQLPNPLLGKVKGLHDPVPFIFTGGRGAVMPMRGNI